MALPLLAPFTAMIVGPSSSGKTYLTLQIVKHAATVIQPPPDKILYCYSIYQDVFSEIKHLAEFHQGAPDLEIFTGEHSYLVIVDDQMGTAVTEKALMDLFTRISHHKRVNVVYLSQNLFFKSKETRTISLNSHYIFLMKSTRDMLQVSCLARQMFPNNSKYMLEVYKDATARPFSYLLIDLKTQTDDKLRLRTGLFPGETQFAYVKK